MHACIHVCTHTLVHAGSESNGGGGGGGRIHLSPPDGARDWVTPPSKEFAQQDNDDPPGSITLSGGKGAAPSGKDGGRGILSGPGCGSGRYGVACQNCPPGKYRNEAMESCAFCPEGTYAALEGQSVCHPCLHGTAANHLGQEQCTTCAAQRYSPEESRCGQEFDCLDTQFTRGYYAEDGVCVRCPNSTAVKRSQYAPQCTNDTSTLECECGHFKCDSTFQSIDKVRELTYHPASQFPLPAACFPLLTSYLQLPTHYSLLPTPYSLLPSPYFLQATCGPLLDVMLLAAGGDRARVLILVLPVVTLGLLVLYLHRRILRGHPLMPIALERWLRKALASILALTEVCRWLSDKSTPRRQEPTEDLELADLSTDQAVGHSTAAGADPNPNPNPNLNCRASGAAAGATDGVFGSGAPTSASAAASSTAGAGLVPEPTGKELGESAECAEPLAHSLLEGGAPQFASLTDELGAEEERWRVQTHVHRIHLVGSNTPTRPWKLPALTPQVLALTLTLALTPAPTLTLGSCPILTPQLAKLFNAKEYYQLLLELEKAAHYQQWEVNRGDVSRLLVCHWPLTTDHRPPTTDH